MSYKNLYDRLISAVARKNLDILKEGDRDRIIAIIHDLNSIRSVEELYELSYQKLLDIWMQESLEEYRDIS